MQLEIGLQTLNRTKQAKNVPTGFHVVHVDV